MKKLIISLLLTGMIMAQEVVELKQPNSAKLIVKFMFKNGSICDPQGKEGLTYTTSQLITQGGTGELTFGDIQDKIYPMAANYYSSVDKEVTIFTFEFHKDWMDQFYPIMIGLITNPSLSQADFDRVKVNQQAYVDQIIRASSDEEYSKKALEDFLFRGTNYQHMIQGKSASVASITLDDVKNYYKNYFTKNNLMIGIAGNYPESFLEKLKSDISKLPDTNPEIPSAPVVKMPDGIDIEIIAKDGAFGSAIFAGYPLSITRADDDFAALMVANSYLGEHRKSYGKLYQMIREERSMNYGDYSYIEWYDNGGQNMLPPSGVPRHSNYFALWIRPVQIAKQLKMQYEELKDVNIGHAHFALRMALREMDKMIKNGISQEDFEATRAFLQSYIKLYIKSPEEQLGYLMDSKMYGRDNYIEELGNSLSKLTLDDVNNAIKRYMQIDNMKITIVTDVSEAEPLAESLRNNSPSPMSYSNLVKSGLPEDVLAEDAATENFNLNVKNVTIVDSKDTFK
ncbi:MAG: insulinase family protein [Chlorobium sp.]|nr:insulinase family protein [Chlorobium sp.]MCW9094990.1 insulinase family protein [Ignavibacteriaceae bacterium]